MAHAAANPALADLIDLAAQVREDEQRDLRALEQRDRAIGRELDHLRHDPPRQLNAWLSRVRDKDLPGPGQRAAYVQQLGGLLVVAAGLVIGWTVAAAVFYYDGSEPVNVVHVLAVFVVAQLLLLLLTALAMLPARVLAPIPGARATLSAMRLLSPGRLMLLAKRFLPASYRQALDEAMGHGRSYERVYGRVQKWLILLWSQVFAVMFNLGALASALYLITFSDLAFAWSTTLQNLDAAAFHQLTSALATPWATFLPAATPSLELVETTRFFRIDPQIVGPAAGPRRDPAAFGGWWPFLILALATYGLLPRLITLALAGRRYTAALRWAALHTPCAAEVLDRLNHTLVQTQATEPEAGPRVTSVREPAPVTPLPAAAYHVINWSDVPLDDAAARSAVAQHLHLQVRSVLHAGGARSVDEDREAIAAASADDAGVLVLVKAWEPPMLELLDFLSDLRRALGDGRAIAVVPLMLDAAGRPAPVDEAHLHQWRKKVAAAGDPWLSLRPLTAEGSP